MSRRPEYRQVDPREINPIILVDELVSLAAGVRSDEIDYLKDYFGDLVSRNLYEKKRRHPNGFSGKRSEPEILQYHTGVYDELTQGDKEEYQFAYLMSDPVEYDPVKGNIYSSDSDTPQVLVTNQFPVKPDGYQSIEEELAKLAVDQIIGLGSRLHKNNNRLIKVMSNAMEILRTEVNIQTFTFKDIWYEPGRGIRYNNIARLRVSEPLASGSVFRNMYQRELGKLGNTLEAEVFSRNIARSEFDLTRAHRSVKFAVFRDRRFVQRSDATELVDKEYTNIDKLVNLLGQD